jgi:hypothetical protein
MPNQLKVALHRALSRQARAIYALLFLLAACLAAFVACWLLYLQPWYQIDPPFAQWFSEHRCLLPRFCELPVWFDQPLAMALVCLAILLFALSFLLYRSLDSFEGLENVRGSHTSIWLLAQITVVTIFLLAVLYQAYQVLVQQAPASSLVWLLGLSVVIEASVIFDLRFAPDHSFQALVGHACCRQRDRLDRARRGSLAGRELASAAFPVNDLGRAGHVYARRHRTNPSWLAHPAYRLSPAALFLVVDANRSPK